MRLTSIRLTNFKRHRSFSAAIRPGLIGLVGKNGSGKSSFLSSMAYAITGTPLGDEPLKDLVTWGEKSGCVEMTFEHNGVAYSLMRPLGKSNASLEGSDGSSVKGTNPVNIRMQDMSGTPFDLFKGIMFVAQDALDAPLRGTEATRKEAFGKLFNCQKYERLRDILQEGVSRASAKTRSTSGKSLEDLEKEKAAADAESMAADTRVKELEKMMAEFDLPSLYRVANSVVRDEAALADAQRRQQEAYARLQTFSQQEVASFDRDAMSRRMNYLDSVVRFVDTGVCPLCGHHDGKPAISKEDAMKERQALNARWARMTEYETVFKEHQLAADLYARLSSATVTREQAEQARRDIARRETLERERLDAVAKRSWWEGQAKSCNDRWLEEKRLSDEADRARLVLTDLEAVRNAFHRDAVQQAIRSYGASQINDRLLGYLAIFNLPYRPSFGPDGLMTFQDAKSGTEHEFSRLSGGQQKLTALAYRLALMQMFAGNVRLAILDEPTYGVDRQNLEMMAESFRALSEYAGQRGLSIFIATHEEALFPAFDQMIEL